MFDVVLTGRSAEVPWRQKKALLGSVGLHLLLLAGVLQLPAPRTIVQPDAARETVTYFELRPPDTPAGGARSAAADAVRTVPPEALIRAAAERQLPRAPAEILDRIPEPSTALAGAPVLPGVQVSTDLVQEGAIAAAYAGARGHGRGGGAAGAGPAAGEPVDIASLAEQPRIANPRFMAQLWSDLYPDRLLRRGIQGQVVVSFIINTDGRIDPSSLEILSATHPEFRKVTLQGCRRLRFRPAKLAGQPVRVRATMPVSWTLPA